MNVLPKLYNNNNTTQHLIQWYTTHFFSVAFYEYVNALDLTCFFSHPNLMFYFHLISILVKLHSIFFYYESYVNVLNLFLFWDIYMWHSFAGVLYRMKELKTSHTGCKYIFSVCFDYLFKIIFLKKQKQKKNLATFEDKCYWFSEILNHLSCKNKLYSLVS